MNLSNQETGRQLNKLKALLKKYTKRPQLPQRLDINTQPVIWHFKEQYRILHDHDTDSEYIIEEPEQYDTIINMLWIKSEDINTSISSEFFRKSIEKLIFMSMKDNREIKEDDVKLLKQKLLSTELK